MSCAGTGFDGRIRVRGSPAKRLSDYPKAAYKQRGGHREMTHCSVHHSLLVVRCSSGVICTEHGLIVPQRRRIGPSTPPDPDAIDDC